MKKIFLLLTAVITLVSMCACNSDSHNHSYDSGTVITDATCGNKKTVMYSCTGCEHTYTKSYTVVHDWKKANCTEPKTCSICKEEDGEALGHSYEENVCEFCKFVSTVDVELPVISDTENVEIKNYVNGEETSSFAITAISQRYETSNNDAVKLIVTVSGKKLSDTTSDLANTTSTLVYKLYDEAGYVVYSGTYTTPHLNVGEEFEHKEFSISNLIQGAKYRLVLTDYYTTK